MVDPAEAPESASNSPAQGVPHIIATLSEQQLAVVYQSDDRANQIVVAGPGTGKSYCLAARVVYLTTVKKVPGHSVLVLGENVDYLSALIDFNTPIAHNTSVVKTFHSLARALLKDFYGPDNTSDIPQVLSRAEEAALFESLRQTKKVIVPDSISFRFSTDQIVRYFGMLAASAITPEVYSSVAESMSQDLARSVDDLKKQRLTEKEINLIHSGKIDSVDTHREMSILYARFREETRLSNRTGAFSCILPLFHCQNLNSRIIQMGTAFFS
jgi:superfamily I DNA/RNA helicase